MGFCSGCQRRWARSLHLKTGLASAVTMAVRESGKVSMFVVSFFLLATNRSALKQ